MEFDKNKVKLKIAISKIKEESDIGMENKTKNIFKTAAITLAAIVVLSTGVAFAGRKVYENIWKTPEKIQILSGNFEEATKITEESKKENITEEKAKEIAINKLKQIGFNTNIVRTNHYKEIDSNTIIYRFYTEDNDEISISGNDGEFFRIFKQGNYQDENIEITKEEAIQIANKYYKLFGFKEGEYEITQITPFNSKESSNKDMGYQIDITYNKKYGEIYNPYEMINIGITAKNKDVYLFATHNMPFDNNEVVITKEEAINIALQEDKKVQTNNIESTKVKLMIVKMNADAYDRINDKNKHYEAIQTPNYPSEERNYYNVDDRVRKAWVVVITYEDNYGEDVVKRYTEGEYSYFVDSTTGEIIGGHTLDYIYSESQH